MSEFALVKMEICGFRGFAKQQELEFGAPLVLISGNNRNGKSSVTNAVEWCLFGPEVAAIRYGDIRERDGWEVKNLRSSDCYVQCELRAPSGEIVTARRAYRTPRKSDFLYQVGDGQKSSEEEKFRALLQVSPTDFFSSVHLHPEIVRSLVVAKPKERKEAIDRLLGLSELRDMANVFAAEKPGNWTTALDQGLVALDRQLVAALEERKRIVGEESAELGGRGFDKSQLSADGARQHASSVADELAQFASRYSLPRPTVTTPTDLSGVRKLRNELPGVIQKLRNETPVLADQANYLIRKNRLAGLKSSYASQQGAVTEADAALANHPEKREIAQLNGALSATTAEGARVDGEMREVAKNASVLDKALEFFQNRPDGESVSCPLCGATKRSVAEWRSHLQQEIKAKNLEPLRARKLELDKQRASLEAAKVEKERLRKRVSDESQILASSLANIEEALGRKLLPTDDAVAVIEAEIKTLDQSLDALQMQVAEINRSLEGFSQAVLDLDRLERIGAAQRDMARIDAISESEAYKTLRAIRLECEQYAQDVELLIEGLNKAVTAEAERRLTTVRNSISRVFADLTDRPDFTGLRVAPAGDGYVVQLTTESGAARTALPVLNHADINCAAISIFLALASSPQISHRLGFVILDDPSQSLDTISKKNLCSVLSGLCDSRQVVVATADAELGDEIARMTKSKIVHSLRGWDPTTGPVIETR